MEHVVQVNDNSVAIGMGAHTTSRGEILFRTTAGASLSLRMDGTIVINGYEVGNDCSLYQAFYWQFGIPFDPGERSTDPFRWPTRRHEQEDRLRGIVKVYSDLDGDSILVANPATHLFTPDFLVDRGSIVFSNAVGIVVRILAGGRVILGELESAAPGFLSKDNDRILPWLRDLMLMGERSM